MVHSNTAMCPALQIEKKGEKRRWTRQINWSGDLFGGPLCPQWAKVFLDVRKHLGWLPKI